MNVFLEFFKTNQFYKKLKMFFFYLQFIFEDYICHLKPMCMLWNKITRWSHFSNAPVVFHLYISKK